MPTLTPTLSQGEARDHVRRRSFPTDPNPRVGVELEWFVLPAIPGASRIDVPTLRRRLAPHEPLPHGSRITYEPGGQIELSSRACRTIHDAIAAIAGDATRVRAALRPDGLDLIGVGLDPASPGCRVNDDPRYVAMETFFDTDGPEGRRMMCSTAAVHVNVGLGRGDEARRRWRLANQLGPTLVAAFANSPLVDGRPSGYRSSRMAAWLAIDASRTAPPPPDNDDPATTWGSYALDANVMLVRGDRDRWTPLRERLSFARWITDGHDLGYPTLADLDYHLTTLFPPVRPRGWLELRMIDMLPDPWWRVAATIPSAILDDAEASARAEDACAPTATLWRQAAGDALGHPALAASARVCFRVAQEALERMGADTDILNTVAAYRDRYVERCRTPADDRLDAWTRTGELRQRNPEEERCRTTS